MICSYHIPPRARIYPPALPFCCDVLLHTLDCTLANFSSQIVCRFCIDSPIDIFSRFSPVHSHWPRFHLHFYHCHHLRYVLQFRISFLIVNSSQSEYCFQCCTCHFYTMLFVDSWGVLQCIDIWCHFVHKFLVDEIGRCVPDVESLVNLETCSVKWL